jgi:Ca2+-binding RTX toxin-like protein
MATIIYRELLGAYGDIESFYQDQLHIQGQKSSDTKVIYKSAAEDQNKIVLTGTGLEWTGDVVTEGTITGITFTTKQGDPYLTIKGGNYTADQFIDAYVGGGIAGVEALVYGAKDTVTGSKISDEITSGAGADLVHGGGGADSLDGGIGKDKLFGDGGNDYIFGGADADRMTGGGGSDSFYFTSGYGKDTIVDFDAKGGGNKQDYLSLDMGEAFTVKKSGDNTVLDFGDGETLTLLDVKRADFSEADIHWLMP